MSTRRQAILDALSTRLGAIQVAMGFATDAGQTVLLGEVPNLGPDDPAVVLALLVGDDTSKYQGAQLLIRLPVHIAIVANADLAESWKTVEAAIGDVKQAIELEDRTLGGLLKSELERGTTRTLPREQGSTVVGAAVAYFCSYAELWGTP
jgi:hypothetical protein